MTRPNDIPEADEPLATIEARDEGWYVILDSGDSIGPFGSLREVEDWMDERERK